MNDTPFRFLFIPFIYIYIYPLSRKTVSYISVCGMWYSTRDTQGHSSIFLLIAVRFQSVYHPYRSYSAGTYDNVVSFVFVWWNSMKGKPRCVLAGERIGNLDGFLLLRNKGEGVLPSNRRDISRCVCTRCPLRVFVLFDSVQARLSDH